MMARPKRLLVAPLNWGLGHATRCIPVIRHLLEQGHEVLLASDGDSLHLLHAEFPELQSFELSGYNPAYSKRNSFALTIARQVPKFMLAVRKEHEQVNRLIADKKIDAVISDNRYGVWSAHVPSALMLHQLNLLMPAGLGWIRPLLNRIHQNLFRKFSYVWVPDAEGSVLSGELSDAPRVKNLRYVGALSRFKMLPVTSPGYDLVAVLSGPEPQRSLLEEILRKQLPGSGLTWRLVRGVVNNNPIEGNQGAILDFLPADKLNKLMSEAAVVLARSGYSTIMDLHKLGKKAILIPTPGQTEQEYLATRATKKGYAVSMQQHTMNIKDAFVQARAISGFPADEFTTIRLAAAVEELLK